MKRVIQTATAAAMYNPVSQATLAPNGMFYTAGMIGRSPENGEMLPSFDAQTHQALRNLGALLREAGGSYKDVMFVQLYLLDMEKIEQFNEIFKAYFPAEPPARAVCQPLKLYPGALVMFTAVACVAGNTV
jgi:2-iminobutanoate/2-iminopropanoate deaminase